MGIVETLSFTYPELLLALGAMAVLIVGVFSGEERAPQLAIVSIAILLCAVVLTVVGAGGREASIFDGAFQIDGFSTYAKVCIFLAAAVAILLSERYANTTDLGQFEYTVLILLASFGMSLMVSSTDLIALYMGVETQSLALYILATFNRDSRRSTEAGLKYFVLGAISSGLLLYGASLIYGFTGATSFEAIAEAAARDEQNVGLVVGLVFLICGLAFKVSAAPFHMWTPDVYEGAPTPVTAFFAAAPKFAAMALFARVMVTSFPGAIDDWRPVISLIAAASMAVGAISAITQTNIKRLMAYSSIGHMGYALLGVAAGTAGGVSALLLYMTIYMIMTSGVFACILMMRRAGGLSEKIEDLAGLSNTNKPLAIALTFLLFSLAGIPPLAGFFGKWFVFVAAVEQGLILLAVFGVLASAVSAYYYLRIIKIIWFDEPAPAFEGGNGAALVSIAGVSAVLMFPVLTIFIGQLNNLAVAAAAALF